MKNNESKTGICETEWRWFAVRTKFRHEKAAAQILERNGVVAYVPIRSVTKKYVRKTRTTEQPVIHSFVFVKINTPQYRTVLETEYVAGFLKFGDNLVAIPEEEIEFLRKLCDSDFELEYINDGLFRKGIEVEVQVGVFAGRRGTLVDFKGKKRLAVEIVGLDQCVIMIEMDRELLKPI